MITFERPNLEDQILSVIDASPSRIPIIVGLDGSGRTTLLLNLLGRLSNSAACQYVNVEGTASTPERFFATLTEKSPFNKDRSQKLSGPIKPFDAFKTTVKFFNSARSHNGKNVIFLLDEVIELRTFESFPGLRNVLRDLLRGLVESNNHFILSTRYITRAQKLLRNGPNQFELIRIPPLTLSEVRTILAGLQPGISEQTIDNLALTVHKLSLGHPSYVTSLLTAICETASSRVDAPATALANLMRSGERLFSSCRQQFEIRLHRARGYGALKAILSVLAEEEPLTLTQIATRIQRTAGSTKDYLSWLEDVDLISVQRKRYSFLDPLLRLWVKLHCQAVPPSEKRLTNEVKNYTLSRLPNVAESVDAHQSETQEKKSAQTLAMIEID